MEIIIPDLSSIRLAARQFIEALSDSFHSQPVPVRPKVVAFYGKMGAGKTTFTKAVCEELGCDDTITSPTFAIINEYAAANGDPIYHFDFYRIKNLEEVYDIGYEDYFYSGHLCLIEWPELVERLLPEETVRVTITEQPDGSRLLSF